MSERIGILLTAGAVEKTQGGYRIEPNPEGKIRAVGALDDFVNGRVTKVYVLGGQVMHGEPLSTHYVDYLRRFSQRYAYSRESIQRLPGAVDTTSDLKKATEELPKEELENAVIYSNKFHLESAAMAMSTFGFNVETRPTDQITKARHHLYPKVVDRVITEDFLADMNKRERVKKLILFIDTIPLVGRFHLGQRILEIQAKRVRQGENERTG